MNPDVQDDIQRRLIELGRTSVRYRAGEVTGTAPLDVALGGSTVSYEDVRSVSTDALQVGDQVAVLVFGNDMLVLGRLLGQVTRSGTAACVFTASATSAVAVVAHGLGAAPGTVTFGALDLNVDGIALVGLDATNLSIQARYTGAVTGTATIMWHAST